MTVMGIGADSDRMVGRARELAELQTMWAQALQHEPRLVLLGGEAGGGKTTLAGAFAASLSGAQLVRGQCVPLGGEGLPYAPVLQVMRELFARYGRDRIIDWAGAGWPSLAPLLPELGATPEPSTTERLRMFEAIARIWEGAARETPLLVVLEDLHWSDESSRHLLNFLTSAVADAPVLLIGTFRTDELTRRHPLRPFLAELQRIPAVRRIDLPRLTRDEVAELVHRAEPDATDYAIDVLAERSEGIPFFVVELARCGGSCDTLPWTLREALQQRIQLLGDETQRLLRLASVAGFRIGDELLAAVSGAEPEAIERCLREAIDAGVLIIDDDAYCFRHALLHEVINEDLLPGEQVRAHHAYAEAFTARPELSAAAAVEIAHHYFAAHDLERAFAAALTAAREARTAPHETLRLYERALGIWERVPDPEAVAGPRVEVLHAAALASHEAGEGDRTLALVDEALDDPGAAEPLVRSRLLLMKSWALGVQMRAGDGELIAEALALTPEHPMTQARAQALMRMAGHLMLRDPRARLGDEIIVQAIAAAREIGDTDIEAHAVNTWACHLTIRGEEDRGIAALRESRALIRNDSGLARYWVNLSDNLHLAGRYAEAVDEAMQGIAHTSREGTQRTKGAMLAGNAAEPLLALGEWQRAEKLINRALELRPPKQYWIQLRLLRAELDTWRGDFDSADRNLAEFRSIAGASHPQYHQMFTLVDARLRLLRRDAAGALATAAATAQSDQHHPSRQLLIAAVAAAAIRELRAGGADPDPAPLLGWIGDLPQVGLTPVLRPLIDAELADETESWRLAVKALTAGPAVLRCHAGLVLGERLIADKTREEARGVLAEAAQLAEQMGASVLTERIARLRTRSGFLAGNGSRATVGLTGRELEVLRLVADGRSNGQIGRELFISTKTASVHVSNILAKLGVSSRGEAAAVAHRESLLAG